MSTETFFLRTLFATCVVACGLTLATMIVARPATPMLADHVAAASITCPGGLVVAKSSPHPRAAA